jgi:hypothetical protein
MSANPPCPGQLLKNISRLSVASVTALQIERLSTNDSYFSLGRLPDSTLPWLTSNRVQGASIKAKRKIAEHVRAYRRRIAAFGEQEVLFKLSHETVARIDELKKHLGLSNRGQVVEQLFQQRRETAQQRMT